MVRDVVTLVIFYPVSSPFPLPRVDLVDDTAKIMESTQERETERTLLGPNVEISD